MDIEIIIRNATLKETRELFAVVPEGTQIRSAGTVKTLRRGIPWSDVEKSVIRDIPHRENALNAYRAAFPDSTRTKHAVYRKHQYLREDIRIPEEIKLASDTIPFIDSPSQLTEEYLKHKGDIFEPIEQVPARIVESHKPPVDMRKHPARVYHLRWQIPFSTRTEKAKYQTAWNLCKKYNLPYPEVIRKIEESGKPESTTVTLETPEPVAIPLPPPVTMDKIPASQNVVGMRVKMCRLDRGKMIPGTLLVTARHNGLIECKYEGKRHIIDATCLEVVEGPAAK